MGKAGCKSNAQRADLEFVPQQTVTEVTNGFGDAPFAAVLPDGAYPGRITTLVNATEKATLPNSPFENSDLRASRGAKTSPLFSTHVLDDAPFAVVCARHVHG